MTCACFMCRISLDQHQGFPTWTAMFCGSSRRPGLALRLERQVCTPSTAAACCFPASCHPPGVMHERESLRSASADLGNVILLKCCLSESCTQPERSRGVPIRCNIQRQTGGQLLFLMTTLTCLMHVTSDCKGWASSSRLRQSSCCIIACTFKASGDIRTMQEHRDECSPLRHDRC